MNPRHRYNRSLSRKQRHVLHHLEESGGMSFHHHHDLRDIKTIALLGQPNCGKSSLFNGLTGSNQHIANWPGVTVEKKEGFFQVGHKIYRLVDLPGIYSLSSYSLEEKVTRDYIINERPDLIINVIDAGHLQRNLLLTFQAALMNVPMVLAVNMMDELSEIGFDLDIKRMEQLLNSPVIPTIAKDRVGIDKLLNYINWFFLENQANQPDEFLKKGEAGSTEIRRNTPPGFPFAIEDSIIKKTCENISAILFENIEEKIKPFSLWIALKIMENDEQILCYFKNHPKLEEKIQEIKQSFTNTVKINESDYIHIWIFSITSGIEKEVKIQKKKSKSSKKVISGFFDLLFLNKYLGILLFFVIMFLVFESTFIIGDWLAGYFETGMTFLSSLFDTMPNRLIASFIQDGIIAGVGNVLLLIPYIFIMFFIMGFLEDIGYMPRASFVMDRFMHKLGLHGKSFIPLLMGFGCNVPAIMAARSLETNEERIKTIMMIPFTSCSARLPVYVLFTAAFFSRYSGLVVFSLYLIGILVSILTGIILNKTLIRKKTEGLIMELPPYRIPRMKNLFFYVWPKVKDYLKKAGSIIFIFSIGFWILSYFPDPSDYGGQTSFIGYIGKLFWFIVKPLGFDWKLSISLVTGFFAKEIVIASLGVLYANAGNLITVLPTVINPINAYGFLLFTLLYVPCVATVAAIKRETQSWFWTILSVSYSIGIAWIISFLFIKTAYLIRSLL